MCFAKSAPTVSAVEPQEAVVRHEADASVTKNSANNNLKSGFEQNIKTTAFGLENDANTYKKTLLGE